MKKVTITLLGASLLAGALYANNNMHEGKMMMHSNSSKMTGEQMEQMKKFHQECLMNLNKESSIDKSLSSAQKQHMQFLNQSIDYSDYQGINSES